MHYQVEALSGYTSSHIGTPTYRPIKPIFIVPMTMISSLLHFSLLGSKFEGQDQILKMNSYKFYISINLKVYVSVYIPTVDMQSSGVTRNSGPHATLIVTK